MPHQPPARAQKRWTPDEEEILRARFGLQSDVSLARRLGRTVAALQVRAARLGINHTENALTASIAGAILGVDSKTVALWISKGYLAGRKAPFKVQSHARPWLILPTDLERFIKTHPERCDLLRMPDSYYRNLLVRTQGKDHVAPRSCRRWTAREDAYLINQRGRKTHPELAAYLHRTAEAVHARLGTLRTQGRLLPYKPLWQARVISGTATAPQLWTAEEDAFLRTHWGQLRPDAASRGTRWTSAELAAHLGRTPQATDSRASRLGLKHSGWARADGWTPADDTTLRTAWQPDGPRGLSRAAVATLAATLGRTVAACRRRASLLGLRAPIQEAQEAA